MTTKILTQAQAEAVYSAMCHLNNVGAQIKVRIPTTGNPAIESGCLISVYEDEEGPVYVAAISVYRTTQREVHDNQAAFAAAYNLP